MGAGTDSGVKICIIGEKASSEDTPLDVSDNVNKFEKNQLDTFTLQSKDVGPIQRIRVTFGKYL